MSTRKLVYSENHQQQPENFLGPKGFSEKDWGEWEGTLLSTALPSKCCKNTTRKLGQAKTRGPEPHKNPTRMAECQTLERSPAAALGGTDGQEAG